MKKTHYLPALLLALGCCFAPSTAPALSSYTFVVTVVNTGTNDDNFTGVTGNFTTGGNFEVLTMSSQSAVHIPAGGSATATLIATSYGAVSMLNITAACSVGYSGNSSSAWTFTLTGGADSNGNHPYTVTGTLTGSLDCLGPYLTGFCESNVTYFPHNTSSAGVTYYIIDLNTGHYTPPVYCPAGGSVSLTLYSVPCPDIPETLLAQQLGAIPSPDDGVVYGVGPSFSPASAPPTGSVGSGGPNNFAASVGGSASSVGNTPQYNPTNALNSGTNSPIIYTAAAGTNAVASQQQGDAAIYQAVTAFAAQNHGDLAALQAAVVASSNTVSGSYSNGTPDIATNFDAQAAAGANAALSGSNAAAGLAGGLPQGYADASDPSSLGSAPAGWTVNVPYGAGYTIDLNPFDLAWVVSLAAWVRNLIKWGLLAGLVVWATEKTLQAVQASGANRQASEAGVAGVFNQIPFVSSIAAAVCAGLITLASVAIVSAGVGFALHYVTEISDSPLSSTAGVSVAVWMTNQFFPLSVMVGVYFATIIFTASLTGVVWFVKTVTLFITG